MTTPCYYCQEDTSSCEVCIHDKADADEIRAAFRARDELAAAKEALEPFAKLPVSRFMTDGITYSFRVDAKSIRRARAELAKHEAQIADLSRRHENDLSTLRAELAAAKRLLDAARYELRFEGSADLLDRIDAALGGRG